MSRVEMAALLVVGLAAVALALGRVNPLGCEAADILLVALPTDSALRMLAGGIAVGLGLMFGGPRVG